MGNALESPVTEKDTVRFERGNTALKVRVFFCSTSPLLDRSVQFSLLFMLLMNTTYHHVLYVQQQGVSSHSSTCVRARCYVHVQQQHDS